MSYLCIVKQLGKLLNILLMCVFVNFVFANTVFIHSHVLADGIRITHSHPYLPSHSHSHSSHSLDNIAAGNTIAGAFSAPGAINAPIAGQEYALIVASPSGPTLTRTLAAMPNRGPPNMC